MTPRQREQFSRLQRDIHQLDRALQRLQREADELHTLFEPIVTDEPDFTAEELDHLKRVDEGPFAPADPGEVAEVKSQRGLFP